jgi:hypothetical protein
VIRRFKLLKDHNFESGSLDLASGTNLVTIHATDWAGNTTTASLTLVWPQPGTPIGGGTFTLEAQVSDPTTTVTSAVNGNTSPALVEANGTVWAQNLALNPGTNTVTLTASNLFGAVTVTNFA